MGAPDIINLDHKRAIGFLTALERVARCHDARLELVAFRGFMEGFDLEPVRRSSCMPCVTEILITAAKGFAALPDPATAAALSKVVFSVETVRWRKADAVPEGPPERADLK